MSDSSTNRTSLERILEATRDIVTTIASLGIIWLAFHIVHHQNGPRDIHQYYQDHFSNLVDPEVAVKVSRSEDGLYRYGYTVGNGFWAPQDIFEFALGFIERSAAAPNSDWARTMLRLSPMKWYMAWIVVDRESAETGIGRGQHLGEFVVTSTSPPAIVESFAANKMPVHRWYGGGSDVITPAGKRMLRYTVGPGKPTGDASGLIERIVPLVTRSTQLGWIHNVSLGDYLTRVLGEAADDARIGDRDSARRRLRGLAKVTTSNSLMMSDEAVTLITLNVEHAISKLD